MSDGWLAALAINLACFVVGLATGGWIWRTRAAAVPADPADPSSPDGDASPAEPDDDLIRLKGVGPKLAELLRGLGVRHFRQIAEWTPEEAADADTRLGRFNGSVARNRLVEQARLLVAAERESGN